MVESSIDKGHLKSRMYRYLLTQALSTKRAPDLMFQCTVGKANVNNQVRAKYNPSFIWFHHQGIQVYQVGSGLSPNNFQLPTSLRLYATGSCRVCVLTSRQKRSNPYFFPVALEPRTSNTPPVTSSPTSVLTTFPLATRAASSPRRAAVTVLLVAEAGVLPFIISSRKVEPCCPPSL
jgi:hypothetical protein